MAGVAVIAQLIQVSDDPSAVGANDDEHQNLTPRDVMDPGPTIFVVDNDDAVRDSLRLLLCTLYDDVQVFDSGQSFLDGHHRKGRACVILDIHLPGMDGFAVIERMRQASIDLPVILITGRSDAAIRNRAEALDAMALLEKPLDYDDLVIALEKALAHPRSA